MDEQPSPMILWCGGTNADQDVSIRLVQSDINQQQVTNLGSRGPLAVSKVHSTRLKKYSEYFQACLSTRWTHPDAPSNSKELSLELIHGLQVASYVDCFSRMYTPLRKNFKGVQTSLDLLRVASQIEFHELMISICRYLSTIHWSEEDELRIRHFSSLPDFPRSQAVGVLARLQIGEQDNEDSRKKLLRGQIEHSLRSVLRPDGRRVHRDHFLSAKSFFEDFFSSLGHDELDSAFEVDVVTIVSEEVKKMLESLHEDCRKHATGKEVGGEIVTLGIDMEDVYVPDFRRKLKGLYLALELLLSAGVAEEVVECLVHLELFMDIIFAAWRVDTEYGQPASKNVALRFCKLVVFIFQEVFSGRLLLEIPDRFLMIESWQFLSWIFDMETQNLDMILVKEEFGKAVEGVFLTLPLQQQMELLQRKRDFCERIFSDRLICTRSLMTLMKRNWPPAEEDALLHGDVEVHGV